MNLSTSEQTTLNFYQWEYKYRGYYHFDTPVDIETPYIPFQHKIGSNIPVIDDGRVPSIFQSIAKLLSPPKKEEKKEDPQIISPTFLSSNSEPELVGLILCFPKEQEILPQRNIEFINMLSYTEFPLSFEIVGTKDEVRIQIVSSQQDKGRIQSHLQAYFPMVILREISVNNFSFSTNQDIAIADFGMNDEFMRPISITNSFSIDPLTSIIATMSSLQVDDIAVFQMLFKGITSPLAKDIMHAVSDGIGGSFFVDAPEMPKCAENKISNPLFSVVMRIATQGNTNIRSQYLAQELARSISTVSSSDYNKLIPLSNVGYSYDFHYYNLHHRLSNRLGFILNSKELNTFVHYPNRTIISSKIGFKGAKTKLLPSETINQKYVLGVNEHNGIETQVMLNDEMRLRHMHIMGVTGVGKSTLIANMMIEDMKIGNGAALFDPHGDIIDDVLLRIPEHRKNDVIIIDPYDTEFPIGFNILSANTDAEKIVLSSDLVSAFKRFATSWGDTMSSVLSQAVNTFLDSSQEGTLIELKRFLLEDSFRKEFLQSVDDPSIHYYWQHEYSHLKKRIAPLLTRIDTFLRPKIVRYMLAQKGGIDFRKCIDEKNIVLIKLSQGLIGEENSYLLGSLFLSKFNQVAQSRQNLPKEQRHPYFIYCDEFQNFITPSISQILSGARKYGLGLILAHQETAQIDDTKILNSVISNPYIRICFRLGDTDAKKLASGFSYFEHDDLQSLNTGQAIVRIGSSTHDCNLMSFPLPKINNETASLVKASIINNTRYNYAIPRAKVEAILKSLLPKISKPKEKIQYKKEEITSTEPTLKSIQNESNTEEVLLQTPSRTLSKSKVENLNPTDFEKQKEKYLEQAEEQEIVRKHRSLQYYTRTMAQQRGFKVTLEEATQNGGRVDVALVNNEVRIAIEISVTNKVDYEVQNIQKCIDDSYSLVYMISDNEKHLTKIKEQALKNVNKKHHAIIHFFSSEELPLYLDALKQPKTTEKRVRGYRVKVNYKTDNDTSKQSSITNIIMKALRKK